MPYHDEDEDEDDFAGDGYGYDEGEDEDSTVPCPYCRRPVYDDAPQCPNCGRYMSRDDLPYRRPWWLWLGVSACLIVLLGGAVMSLATYFLRVAGR